MGFGTTTRARWTNAMPLRFRFALPMECLPHAGIALDARWDEAAYARQIAQWGAHLESMPGNGPFPGWDADGSPVML